MTKTMFDPIADVEEFHTKFGLQYKGKPRALPADLSKFRIDFLIEELDEYIRHSRALTAELSPAMLKHDNACIAYHLEEMLDALVDQVYVALGTAHLHGFDFREAWRRVHEKNLQKVRVDNVERSTRRSLHDVIKPPGWSPPSHIDLVEDHAHKD